MKWSYMWENIWREYDEVFDESMRMIWSRNVSSSCEISRMILFTVHALYRLNKGASSHWPFDSIRDGEPAIRANSGEKVKRPGISSSASKGETTYTIALSRIFKSTCLAFVRDTKMQILSDDFNRARHIDRFLRANAYVRDKYLNFRVFEYLEI